MVHATTLLPAMFQRLLNSETSPPSGSRLAE